MADTKVRFRVPTVGVKAGEVVEVDAATAKRLVDGRHADKVKPASKPDKG